MSNYELHIEGVDLAKFELRPEAITQAASRAINYAVRRGRTLAAREIAEEVAFPTSYLNESQGRLVVARFASPGDLEGRIRGRQRATSLARFAQGTLTHGKPGVHVSVKPGRSSFLKNAFPLKLRAGSAEIETAHNMGLAVRLKAGEVLRNKSKLVQLKAGQKSSLYLLYGPSVDQIFRTVRVDITPQLEADLTDEFVRQVDLFK